MTPLERDNSLEAKANSMPVEINVSFYLIQIYFKHFRIFLVTKKRDAKDLPAGDDSSRTRETETKNDGLKDNDFRSFPEIQEKTI